MTMNWHHNCMSREMALMMLWLLLGQVVGFFPFIKQMTYFGIFTWNRNASSFGQGWPSWGAGFCPARCSEQQPFSSREDPVSERTIFPKFLSKGTEDCFEIKTSPKVGCMMAARPDTRCYRNLGTDQTDQKGSSALSSPSSKTRRRCYVSGVRCRNSSSERDLLHLPCRLPPLSAGSSLGQPHSPSL